MYRTDVAVLILGMTKLGVSDAGLQSAVSPHLPSSELDTWLEGAPYKLQPMLFSPRLIVCSLKELPFLAGDITLFTCQ